MSARSRLLVVVPDSRGFPSVPGARIMAADAFLAAPPSDYSPRTIVVNLCPSDRYRSKGYYVSLLSEARGMKVIPSLETSEGLGDPYALFRALQVAHVPTVDLKEMQTRRRSLPAAIASDDDPGRSGRSPALLLRVGRDDELSFRAAGGAELAERLVFFGRCEDRRFQAICRDVYEVWPAPALRVRLLNEDDHWKVIHVALVDAAGLRGADRARFLRVLRTPKLLRPPRPKPEEARIPSIAILYDEKSLFAPSTTETLEKLEKIAKRKGILARRIGMGDLARLGEYDALFVRAYTGVTTPAFQFALRAEALGKPTIDDTQSIIRCSNKIYLHELLTREGVPTPRAMVATPHTRFDQLEELGLPFVIKQPDGAFSAAVHKVMSKADYVRHARKMFQQTPLLIAQEWLPTEFDWRVTTLGGKVLFPCRYHMARGHWRIRAEEHDGINYGKVEAVPRDYAPREVVRVALRATREIGDGLYGVDIKDTARGPVVIEINDNPNLDLGYEDAADGDAVYVDLLDWFAKRIERARAPLAPPPEREPEDAFKPLRRPIGRPPEPRHLYRPFEVCGLELEYPMVDRDLNVVHKVAEVFQAWEGHPASDVDLGIVGFSNEIMDHVLEVKTQAPLKSLVQTEEVLVEAIRRLSTFLWGKFEARLLPTGMHPWLRPDRARLWQRSNSRIYDTYARLFDLKTHGWANVQASHVNLPFGTDEETVAMMNASALLVPYLPAIAASTPMYEGEVQASVDNRMAWILGHQTRVPESCGLMIPEFTTSLRHYRRDVLGPMYRAVDRLPDARILRQEFFNARSSVFKFSRRSMEVRVIDMQECVKMDVAIAAFVRSALKALTGRLLSGKLALPDHAALVRDLHATIKAGSRATVEAPHLQVRPGPVRDAIRELLALARPACRKDELPYLDLVERVADAGTLSERIRAALEPWFDREEEFTDAARKIYIELADCLESNTPWRGRGPGFEHAAENWGWT